MHAGKVGKGAALRRSGLCRDAERWRMKIPEGPHTFLTTRALAAATAPWFDIVEGRTFLACPGGPAAISAAVDRIPGRAALGWGFFQYVVARRR